MRDHIGRRSGTARALRVSALALTCAAAVPATASATMFVSSNGSRVLLEVTPTTGDGHHSVLLGVRPEATPGGETVRSETILFTSVLQTFTAPVAAGPGLVQCNAFFGSASCPGTAGSPIVVDLRMGNEGDNVTLDQPDADFVFDGCDFPATLQVAPTVTFGSDRDGFHAPTNWVDRSPTCQEPAEAVGPVTVRGNGGDDVIVIDPGGPAGTPVGPLVADGGPGKDEITGGLLDDRLNGGANTDTIRGGDGDDTIDGGTNADAIRGGDGDDTIVSAALDGADAISGGRGFDTLDYSDRTRPLNVTMGQPSRGDGETGEGDDVQDDVNHLIGGQAGDVLVGTGGAETVDGGPGDDIIEGGLGPDTLNGGAGTDAINAVDGVADVVSCGPGVDAAVIDLKDAVGVQFVTGPFGTVRVGDCETVTRQAVDDSPPGRILGVRIVGGRASVGLRCPRVARPRCSGRLTLRDTTSGQALGSAAYDLDLGELTRVDVPLGHGALGRIRRGAPVLAATVERGHSTRGPRRAARLFMHVR